VDSDPLGAENGPVLDAEQARDQAILSPTTTVVAPTRLTFPNGMALAAAWSAIGSQPVTSWRISGTSSWYATQPMKALVQ
jgi:hypothetical protein